MTEISGITDFIDQAGARCQVFDMGRRMQALSREQFLAFERDGEPYPYPLQQQAWLGIMVWHDSKPDDLVIWFVKFPLDAHGCLASAIRDDFVFRLINKDEPAESGQEDSNPYGFKPKQEHMASFHARAARILGQPPSRFYEHARDYFSGTPGFDQWAFVGFQGIADVVARLDEDDNHQRLADALPQLPAQPLEAVCQCLEHEIIDDTLGDVLGTLLQQTLVAADAPDAYRASLLIRAVSGAENQDRLAALIEAVLNSPLAEHPEVIASISGRCWLSLQQPRLMNRFLEVLARCPEGQAFFNLVIVDLINIPGMQAPIHTAIRDPERSDTLARAIGELFQQYTQ